MTYLAVALGGAAGAVVRYALGGAIMEAAGLAFPLGTLWVNVLGSLFIGVFLQLGLEREALTLEMRLLLTTGFCGGFTTFSAFAYETLELMQQSRWDAAAANVLLNVVLCVVATGLGWALARAF